MILDTSAIVSIIMQEPDCDPFRVAVADARTVRLSAATLLEATMVIEARSGPEAGRDMERWLALIGAEICPVTERTARLAQEGWRRYGKGRHKAALNLGDCFSYALAKDRDEALLFKGDDFAQTDVKAAI